MLWQDWGCPWRDLSWSTSFLEAEVWEQTCVCVEGNMERRDWGTAKKANPKERKGQIQDIGCPRDKPHILSFIPGLGPTYPQSWPWREKNNGEAPVEQYDKKAQPEDAGPGVSYGREEGKGRMSFRVLQASCFTWWGRGSGLSPWFWLCPILLMLYQSYPPTPSILSTTTYGDCLMIKCFV